MTLSRSFDDQAANAANILDGSTSSWDVLYCSHLWADSNLRREIITAPFPDNKVVTYCYTCKGKIRKYEVKSPLDDRFTPKTHSTPNGKLSLKAVGGPVNDLPEALQRIQPVSNTQRKTPSSLNVNQCIPSISRQIDSSFRQKYISYEIQPNNRNRRRLRKSLKGIGCIVNFTLPDTPVKKRTQIQACSISVMIVAIVVISFILVNFTSPNFTRAAEVVSPIAVPTQNSYSNESSSAIIDVGTAEPTNEVTDILNSTDYTKEPAVINVTEDVSLAHTSLISNIISKIRKNIRTYPKDSNYVHERLKPKDINNRDSSKSFCSCQTNEVCMLDENTGTAICKSALDVEDPTGCGGLCALETEACQLVDRKRGVRVCRLLTLMTCSSNEWRCHNGLCVPARARCDGSIQCYDRSDEMHCDCDLTKEFRCGHSISCFPNTRLCDGIIDCWDGFDEVNCTTVCPGEQFTCTDGQCILPSRFCDGLADCADGSDEPRGCGGACAAKEMRCANHRCVPLTQRCNGRDDCGDGSDEAHCAFNKILNV